MRRKAELGMPLSSGVESFRPSPSSPRLRAGRCAAAIAALFLLLGTDTMAATEGFQIDIDEGTVNVVVEAGPMAEPYELSYAPQGSCVPEVMITTSGSSVSAHHTKNCHGTGRNEGTIFTLKLSAANAYDLKLKAGRVNISGALGENGLNHFNGAVSVGGIKSQRPDLNVAISRHLVVGATASFGNADDSKELNATVTYGQINIL
jgi:hypothetical protein